LQFTRHKNSKTLNTLPSEMKNGAIALFSFNKWLAYQRNEFWAFIC